MAGPVFCIETEAQSHVGMVRQLNEDRAYADPVNGVWVVADGMGGHEAGDFASDAIVRHLQASAFDAASAMDLESAFRTAILRANDEIYAVSRQRGNVVIGSTIVGLLTYGNVYRCYWSGDSRAYLLRGDMLARLTRDHTEVQDLLDRGLLTEEEARVYPHRNAITHAIGVGQEAHLDYADGDVQAGDVFLLSSDGLTAHLEDLEIGRIMTGRRARDICQELVNLALYRGGTDNVTVNVVRFLDASAPDAAGFPRQFDRDGMAP
ncbi:PP2C family protein-serine/threonine phosphatase [Sinorhizobium fredii]|uniref:PP2C family protein-serine/threonine phosphatase n=1 Tax=Rhizobium fredii TaxID=380 RepID=UPI0004B4DCD1|nr:protein phosphatase 2C domain-containing protein [Sinorhizobium fredii]